MQEQQKNIKKLEYCSVSYCLSKSNENNVYFHRPPTNKKLHKKWLIALKMVKLTLGSRICSEHFVDFDYFPTARKRLLKRNAIPSQHIPVTLISEIKKNAKQRDQRRNRAAKRCTGKSKEKVEDDGKVTTCTQTAQTTDDSMEIEPLDIVEAKIEQYDEADNSNLEDTASQHDDYQHIKNSTSITQTEEVEESVSKVNRQDFVFHLLDSDKNLNSFCGIATHQQLDALVKCVELLRQTKQKKSIVMPIKHSIVMTCMKLKQNFSYTVLSILFGISIQLAKKYFISTLQELCAVLSPQIRWPSKAEILENMPKCFEKYKNTRIVLDCFEVYIKRSKCLKCRIPTFSTYKSHHTVKFLLGVTPSGLISYVSKAYGGRVSDKQIFVRSKLLERLKRSVNAVMVDRGFLIDKECAEYDIKLIRPPFLRKKVQFSNKQAIETRDIASARVNIERKIQRIRQYEIIKGPLGVELVPYSNIIVRVLCGMANLQSPILSQDKFLQKSV